MKLIIKLIIILLLVSSQVINHTNSFFIDTEKISNMNLKGGCWTPPSIPLLLFPLNGTIITDNSNWGVSPYFDWDDSKGCNGYIIRYQFELYSDQDLNSLVFRSGLIDSSSIPYPDYPTGIYFWRVRTFDGDRYSDWSEVWVLNYNVLRDLP